MVGNAAHGNAGALCQREVQEGGGLAGVPVEHLVEVAEPKEEDGVREIVLDAPVLRHHGGCFGHGERIIVWCDGRGQPGSTPSCWELTRGATSSSARGSIRATLCYPLRERLLARLEDSTDVPAVFVDLSECVYMDSTFIGLLVAVDRRLRKGSGGRLHILRPSPPCMELLPAAGAARASAHRAGWSPGPAADE